MRILSLAALVALSPLAAASGKPAPEAEQTVVVGIEHSLPLARPSGAKAAVKPKVATVEDDGHLIPLHLHVSEDGTSRIECRESHQARTSPNASPEAAR